MYRPNRVGPYSTWQCDVPPLTLSGSIAARTNMLAQNPAVISTTVEQEINEKTIVTDDWQTINLGEVISIGIPIETNFEHERYIYSIVASAHVFRKSASAYKMYAYLGKTDSPTLVNNPTVLNNTCTSVKYLEQEEQTDSSGNPSISIKTSVVVEDEQYSDRPLIAGIGIINVGTGSGLCIPQFSIYVQKYKTDIDVFDPTR